MTPKRQPTPDDVAARLEGMLQEMARHRTPGIVEIGITMAQTKVLHVVAAAGEVHMSELVHVLSVSVSTVSELVDRLVEQGFVARRDDPADRRQVVVSLTPAGAALVDRFRDLSGVQIRALLERLSPADLAAIDQGVRALHAAAVDLRTSPPTSPEPGRGARPASRRKDPA
jgi:DNA-binding MarR family transcriptional regulator